MAEWHLSIRTVDCARNERIAVQVVNATRSENSFRQGIVRQQEHRRIP